MDWRFFGGGVAIMATGIIISIIFGAYLTTGPLEDLNRNRSIAQLGGIIGGIGFLILLVSFGFSRRKKGASGKGVPVKPDESS
jgi:hypothetical protein